MTTIKSSPDLTMVVHLNSPNDRYDMLYLRNYAVLNVKDQLAKIEGVGSVQLFGSGDYAMRIWLDPQKIAERGLTADDVVNAIRQQNVQVAAGVINGPPYSDKGELQLADQCRGPADRPRAVRRHRHQERENGVVTRLERRRAGRDRRLGIRPALAARQQAGGGASRSSSRPARTRSQISDRRPRRRWRS